MFSLSSINVSLSSINVYGEVILKSFSCSVVSLNLGACVYISLDVFGVLLFPACLSIIGKLLPPYYCCVILSSFSWLPWLIGLWWVLVVILLFALVFLADLFSWYVQVSRLFLSFFSYASLSTSKCVLVPSQPPLMFVSENRAWSQ